MSFNISAKVYAINNAFFFTKILKIEKQRGDRGGRRKIFEKPGGDGTNRNIAKILQK